MPQAKSPAAFTLPGSCAIHECGKAGPWWRACRPSRGQPSFALWYGHTMRFKFDVKGADGFWHMPDDMPSVPMMYRITATNA